MQNLSTHQYPHSYLYENGRLRLHLGVTKSDFYYYCKRLCDITLILLSLVILLPIILIIALLIKLDSPGPAFFVQARVGSRRKRLNRQTIWEIRNFPFIKFRSMFVDADQSMHKDHIKAFVEGTLDNSDSNMDGSAAGSATFKLCNDPRVTRMGRFLRKTSLDELPQLFNVLRGEMSLVGPRPVPPYEVEAYQERHYERLAALPGITGAWQVSGRGRVSFEKMMQMDITYVRNQSFWSDLKILLGTIPAVLSGIGAE